MFLPEGLVTSAIVTRLFNLLGGPFKRTEGGTGASMGTATLVAGTVVVATTAVTANSRILYSRQLPHAGALGNLAISARVAGTSFTILSDNAADVSDVAWMIVEPN